MTSPLPPLATVGDVEALFGRVELDDTDRVTRLLAWASAAVRRYCRQDLSLVTDDVATVLSPGTAVITMAQRPVVAVASVDVGSVWGSWHWPAARHFTWDAFGRLERHDGLTWGLRHAPVTVTYTHGYDPVPDDLVALVAGKVAGFLSSSGANPGGLKSLQVGAMSETYANAAGSPAALGPGALTEAEQDALMAAGYRLQSGDVPIGAP
jgi:hypothetical protein